MAGEIAIKDIAKCRKSGCRVQDDNKPAGCWLIADGRTFGAKIIFSNGPGNPNDDSLNDCDDDLVGCYQICVLSQRVPDYFNLANRNAATLRAIDEADFSTVPEFDRVD